MHCHRNSDGIAPVGSSGSNNTVLQIGAGTGPGVEVSTRILSEYHEYGFSAGSRGALGAYGAIGQQFNGNYNFAQIGCR